MGRIVHSALHTYETTVQRRVLTGLATLHDGLPKNKAVRLLEKNSGVSALTPLDAQSEPANLAPLKAAVTREWPMSSLLDVLKEASLRIDFTEAFKSVGAREILDRPAKAFADLVRDM